MIGKKSVVALFDFDGVVMDTESQYSKFWNAKGKEYFPNIENFGDKIKGQTLTQICDRYFDTDAQRRIEEELDRFEESMIFDYIPGALPFIKELKEHQIKIGIVTSSNEKKMNNVYKAHPELLELVDKIFTAEMFSRSKPNPDCFLLGASYFDTKVEDCIVFEDSFHGLEAGRKAGMFVVGLSTTNKRDEIIDKADYVISDFTGFNYDKLIKLL